MGCNCRKGTRAGSVSPSGATVLGFEYTSPDMTVTTFLTLLEAKKEQRRNGGGTIKQLTG